MNHNKIPLVLLEGVDKSGKTTIYQALRRKTEYGPLVIDRFTGSNICHDIYYKRRRLPSVTSLLMLEGQLSSLFDVTLVVLTAERDILQKRIESKEKGLDLFIALDNFVKLDEIFKDYIKNTSRVQNRVLIDTGYYSPSDCVDIIIAHISNYPKEDISYTEYL